MSVTSFMRKGSTFVNATVVGDFWYSRDIGRLYIVQHRSKWARALNRYAIRRYVACVVLNMDLFRGF